MINGEPLLKVNSLPVLPTLLWPKKSPAISGVSLGGVRISRFANGEIYVRYDESIRGVDVFVVQPFSKPVNETLMELSL